MKKRIVILVTGITCFFLMAFSYVNWNNNSVHNNSLCQKHIPFNDPFVSPINNPNYDFLYKVESRFMTTITRNKLVKAKSLTDILPAKCTESIKSYQANEVAILGGNEKISRLGEGEQLNDLQMQLLSSTNHSSNIFVSTTCINKNAFSGELQKDSFPYYITVIPENEAQYKGGLEALISYLKKESNDQVHDIDINLLKPGRVNFTITKNGIVANTTLDASCGNQHIDEIMVNLISKVPGKWQSATNIKGEKVEQNLVFFFGKMGC